MAYAYYRTITIDHGKCGTADSTDWVLTFDTTAAWLKTVANGGNVHHASGYDIAFYAVDGTTQLDHKIIRYDGTAGRLVARVRIPTLSASTDTVLRIYYSDSGISTSQEDQAGTFSAGFLAYYPLGDGSTLDATDHSGNGYDLTVHGSWGAAAGKVDGGTAESNGTDQYLSDSTMATPDSITVSFWQYIDTGDASNACMFYFRGSSAAGQRLFLHCPFSDNVIYWDYGNNTSGSGRVTTSYSGKYDQWVHVAVVYDDSTGLHAIYLNGALAASHTSTTANPGMSSGIFINACNDGPTLYDKRNIDELTFANVGRSASWIAAEYNNQLNPDSFYSLLAPSVFDGGVFDGDVFDTGTVIISGAGAVTLGALTGSATATLALAAQASVTLGTLTGSATATLALTGQSTATLGALTGSATGESITGIAGEGAVTLGTLTGSATGVLAIAASGSVTLGPLTGTASGGASAIAGEAAVTLGALTGSATATLALAAQASATLGTLTGSATGAGDSAVNFTRVRFTRGRLTGASFQQEALL